MAAEDGVQLEDLHDIHALQMHRGKAPGRAQPQVRRERLLGRSHEEIGQDAHCFQRSTMARSASIAQILSLTWGRTFPGVSRREKMFSWSSYPRVLKK